MLAKSAFLWVIGAFAVIVNLAAMADDGGWTLGEFALNLALDLWPVFVVAYYVDLGRIVLWISAEPR